MVTADEMAEAIMEMHDIASGKLTITRTAYHQFEQYFANLAMRLKRERGREE